MKNTQFIFLALLLILVVMFALPIVDFHGLLSTGDHGKDLYCFKKTLDGQMPYKDYWWDYGPLMPYYYSLFYKLFGINILSVLYGRMVLVLLSACFFYLTLTTLIPPSMAFLGAFWFLFFNQNYFFTYNHIGGTVMVLATIFCLFLYLKKPKISYQYWGLLCIFILSLIKINFGISSLVVFVLSCLLINFASHDSSLRKTNTSLLLGSALILILVGIVYYSLLQGLSLYEIRRCLPYMRGDQPYEASFLSVIQFLYALLGQNLVAGMRNFAFGFIIFCCLAQIIISFLDKKTDPAFKKKIALALSMLLIFYLSLLHEFLISGVLFRSNWSQPISYLMIFIILYAGLKNLSPIFRILLFIGLAFELVVQMNNSFTAIRQVKVPSQYFNHPRGKVYLGSSPLWIKTVLETTSFLEKNLKANELFFALPYDPLYYFLADKDSPTRQLIFFEYIKIPQEQESKIIQDLEKADINWVVLSSRANSTEKGLGVLGKTYCPLIGKYLMENFEVVAQFGDWVNPGGWGWNHGTRVLKRK